MNLVLRAGTPADAGQCGPICYEAFASIATHHDFPPDLPSPEAGVDLFEDLFSRSHVYSVVAELDGRVVGSNFLWETSKVAGVGPITVDPTAQNAAVGRQLMLDVLRRAEAGQFASVRLVQAAYHNRSLSLYAKLGFDAREPLSTLQGPPLGVAIAGHPVRAALAGDVEACERLCLEICGHVRGVELRGAVDAGRATVVEHDGEVSGYATSLGFFDHAVGRSNEDLKALIGAASVFSGPGFLLPTRNTALLRWCLAHGLRIVQPMTLMSRGLYSEPDGVVLPSIIY